MPPTDASTQPQPDNAEGHAIAWAIVSLLREMRAEGARRMAEAQTAQIHTGSEDAARDAA